MTRVLRELIGAAEPSFSLRIRELEEATGRHTVDIALASDVMGALATKLKQLGLDPHDTTPQELHSALKHKVLQDDALLRRSYHGNLTAAFTALNDKAPTVAVPVFKMAAFKRLLKKQPPKRVMAKLGYRSVDSLLKRADMDQVMAGVFLHESLTWHRAFAKSLRALKDADITLERPRAVLLDPKLVEGMRAVRPIYIQSAGIAGIPVANPAHAGSWLHAISHAAEGLYLVHQRGVYLKLHRFKDSFLKELIGLTYTAPRQYRAIRSISVPWTAIYLHASHAKHTLGIDDEAAVDSRDFFWRHPSEALPLVDRRIDFWSDTDLIGKPHREMPISLNINDIAPDTYFLIPYEHSSFAALSRALRAELLARYLHHSPERDQLLRTIGIIS